MTDSDFSFISPVEIVHNVPSVAPAQEREARKRRQKPPEQQQQQEPESSQQPENETPQEEPTRQDDSPHKIDYCA